MVRGQWDWGPMSATCRWGCKMKYKECVVFNIDRIDVFVLQQKKIHT